MFHDPGGSGGRPAAVVIMVAIMNAALALLLLLAAAPAQDKSILTPPPGPAPRINGPKVYGARPGRPFLYRIPATGERPMRFSAAGLPASLRLDPTTGIISGSTPDKAGGYAVTLQAKNGRGSARRAFRIVVGDTLALTPPMGWNHWYTHYTNISDKLLREAADVMVSSGMADAGYQYVSIDDCWMAQPGSSDPELAGEPRGANGALLPNKRFPGMRALTDYIHAKGLKAGIYTSPGPLTCARFAGSHQHEEADARQFAAWGFDFLKYDWCTYRTIVPKPSLDEMKAPYSKMGGILKTLDRDIVFNLCQYGMGEVWKWGGEVGGHCWRTTGDLGLERGGRLPGFYHIGLRNAKLAEYAGPGRWNDPDYLILGWFRDARNRTKDAIPTPLTADEQYSYMSMWCLMAAPLFFSGDMGKLDAFTLNVLTNAEVIDIDQDALGKQARILRQSEDELVLVKPLEDGTVAVGLFNLSEAARTLKVTASEIGLKGKFRARDLWRQKDLGGRALEYSAEVPRHGVSLIRAR